MTYTISTIKIARKSLKKKKKKPSQQNWLTCKFSGSISFDSMTLYVFLKSTLIEQQ